MDAKITVWMAIGWWAFGFVSAAAAKRLIDGQITVGNLFAAAFLGITGPLVLIAVAAALVVPLFSYANRSGWMDKRIL